jgi:hypothetical protein
VADQEDQADEHSYLAGEPLARVEIDKLLSDAGWLVQQTESWFRIMSD